MSDMFRPVVLIQNLLLLVSGFTLLLLASDKLVENAVLLAHRWKVPASVIAVTFIAAGTSAPELVTSFIAGYQGISDIAVGNVVGSNIFNILAIAGIALIMHPKGVISGAFFTWPILVVASVVFIFFLSDFKINRYEGVILSMCMLAFLVLSFFQNGNNQDGEITNSKSLIKTLTFFIASLIGLALGAHLALIGGVELGRLAGLSERIIGITIMSVGTGLPELATTMAALNRGHEDVAIANVLGSNVFNTMAIPGITAIFFPLDVHQKILNLDSFVLLAATFFIGSIFFLKRDGTRRVVGLIFLGAYIIYVVNLVR